MIPTRPLLQVAFDYVDGHEMLRLAELVQDSADIFEIGTLLLKREGIGVIAKLKQAFPEKMLFVDTKTVDLGQLETRMIFDAGADMMSVCSAALDLTIELAIREAHALDKRILVELLDTGDFYRQIKRLRYFQPDYVTVYNGIDERPSDDPLGDTLFDKVELLSKISPIPLAVAGGVRLDDIPYLLLFQPAIIIVGTSITSSPDPQHTAHAFLKSLQEPSF